MPVKSALVLANSAVSGPTAELLLDLVEIKLGCIEVYDRDDARELKALQKARKELCSLLGRSAPEDYALGGVRAGRGRRRPAVAGLHV